jgi:hypothetical protein
MAVNIKLLVHGVPNGQKMWGVTQEDEVYINLFYSEKYSVEESMYVGKFNGAYFYTFVIGQNVLDKDGRAGSYLALTIKINAFYADVINMYNLLKASFLKIVVGKCIKGEGSGYQFMVGSFSQIESDLKELEQQIIKSISLFSTSQDIIQLPAGNVSNERYSKGIYLYECTNMRSQELIRNYRSFAVSILFPSKQIAEIQDSCKNRIDKAESEKLAEINRCEVNCKQKLQQQETSYSKEREALEGKIVQMKTDLQTERERISANLGQQIKNLESEVKTLTSENSRLSAALTEEQKKSKKYENELEKLRNQCQQTNFLGSKKQKDASDSLKDGVCKVVNEQSEKLQTQGATGLMKDVKFVLLILNTLILVSILLFAIYWKIFSDPEQLSPSANEKNVNPPTEKVVKPVVVKRDSIKVENKTDSTTQKEEGPNFKKQG